MSLFLDLCHLIPCRPAYVLALTHILELRAQCYNDMLCTVCWAVQFDKINHMVQLLNLGNGKIKNFDPHELCYFRSADSRKNRPHWNV